LIREVSAQAVEKGLICGAYSKRFGDAVLEA
jgi:hypothetical protein